MKSTSHVAAQIFPGAVFLGALGDVLLRQGPWGISFGLWIAALAGVIFWASRLPGAAASYSRLLLLPIGFALHVGCISLLPGRCRRRQVTVCNP